MLDEIKLILGLNNNEYDKLINSRIASAKKDLEESGILASKILETDNLIRTAIQTYVQAQFEVENKLLYISVYEQQKDELRKNSSYTSSAIVEEVA